MKRAPDRHAKTVPGGETKPTGTTCVADRPGRVTLGLLILAVAVATLIAHWPVLTTKALSFDDDQYLIENSLVRNPSWTSAKRFLVEVLEPSTVGGYYQPLAMISLMLDYAMGGRPDNLRVFHRTSLALHVINTSLLIVFLYLLFGQPFPAAMVGLLFGVHPMTVEPIPWVGERKTLLASFFALWSLILYVRYARNASGKAYISCVAFYFLALMSKPTSVPLPICMLLLDWWPLRRLSQRAIVEKLPLLILAGVFAVVTVISQARTAAITLPSQHESLRPLLVLCHNIIFYPCKMIWPANLSSHYPFPNPLSMADPMVRTGVIGTCVLIPMLLISLRWTRSLLVGWLFFFVAIFPTMGVIGFTMVIASDKFAYLPFAGLSLPIAWLLVRLWTADRSRGSSGPRRAALSAVIVLLVIPEIGVTRRYLSLWRDTETIHQYMIALAPNEGILPHNLGRDYFRQGRLEEALAQFDKALRLNPKLAHAHVAMGVILERQGKKEQAIEHYRQTLELKPDYGQAHNNLGRALLEKNEIDQAVTHFATALKLDPTYTKARRNLAMTLAKQGDLDQAIMHYEKLLQHQPHDLKACRGIADAFADRNKPHAAIRHYREYLQLKPDDADVYNELGIQLGRQNKIAEAIAAFTQAVRFDPNLTRAHFNLATAQAMRGKLDEAIQHYRELIRLDPHHADTYASLGALLDRQGRKQEAIDYYRKALQVDPNNAKAQRGLNRSQK